MSEHDNPIEKPRAGKSVARGSWWAVLLLLVIGLVNYLDRALPAILAEPIRRDLGMSDTAIGLVNGFAFLVVYATASVPLAYLSDRGAYRSVIIWSLAAWSAMTAAGSFVTTGWQLAVTRMGVAFGEAGATPAAHAYITRHFAPGRRTLALAIFTLCTPLGSMLGYIVGGLAGEHLGWRATLLYLGVGGVVLSLVTAWIFPRTGVPLSGVVRAAPTPISHAFRKRSLWYILAGTAFIGMAGYTAVAFTPAFLMRSHGMSLAEAGLGFGLAAGIGGSIGLLAVGWIADRLSRRDPRWLIGCIVMLIGAALPISFLSFTIEDNNLAVAALSVNFIVPIAYSAPIITAFHRLVPEDVRARASAFILLATSVLGGLGPAMAGLISDLLRPTLGEGSLGAALMVIPMALAFAMFFYLLALSYFRDELVE